MRIFWKLNNWITFKLSELNATLMVSMMINFLIMLSLTITFLDSIAMRLFQLVINLFHFIVNLKFLACLLILQYLTNNLQFHSFIH